MLKELSAENIYIVCGHTDMRKSIDGLAAIVQQQYKKRSSLLRITLILKKKSIMETDKFLSGDS